MRIESLTSLRFFAALLVLLNHCEFLRHSDSILLKNLFDYIFSQGHIAITFFFILSGFIMSLSYSDKINTKKVSYTQFYIARISKLYPLHLLTFFLALPLVIYSIYKGSDTLNSLLPNLFLIQSFIPVREYFFSVNAPSWSLSNELFYYLIFPVIISMKNKLLLIIPLVIIIFQLTIELLNLPENQKHYLIYIFPISRLLDFSIGILTYRVFRKIHNKKITLNSSTMQISSILLFVAFLLLIELVIGRFNYYFLYVIPVSLLVFSFSLKEGVLSNLLTNEKLVSLGKASFALYLIHHLVIRYMSILNYKIFKFEGVVSDYFMMLSTIVISIALSIIMYNLFELKTTEILRSFLLKKINKL